MVGISCGMLGVFIVLRNMALIGDALSHAILPGIVIAFMVFGGYHLSGFFAGAVVAGLIAAVAITWIQQNLPTKNDAAIGIIFTVMFAVGVIGISILSRNEGVHLDLKDFLFGNILGVSRDDLWLNFFIMLAVVGSIVAFYRYFYLTTFQESFAKAIGVKSSLVHYYLMLLLSFTVVASLQTVGVILVVAMLVTPSSTAVLWSDRLKIILLIAAGFGVLSAVSGLIAAIYLEIPPGPSMAVCAFVFFLISALISPQKGYVFQYFRKRHYRFRILREDILKYAFKLGRDRQVGLSTIASEIGRKLPEVKTAIRKMAKKGLVRKSNGTFALTAVGAKRGRELVRAHRLWETWLVEKTGLNEDQIHEDAEFYEHLLYEEMLDQIDASLGFPEKDPHGTPIPQKYIRVPDIVENLKPGDLFVFPKGASTTEDWERVSGKKLSGKVFELKKRNETHLIISESGKQSQTEIVAVKSAEVYKLTRVQE